jgi:hypothetical protein
MPTKKTVFNTIAAQFAGTPGDLFCGTVHAADLGKGHVTESWCCVDCGVDTAPGCLDGSALRRELTLKPKVSIHFDASSEAYMVRRHVWKRARMKPLGGCLCIGCLERRLGRRLRPKDFEPGHELNAMPGTPRLLSRRRGL